MLITDTTMHAAFAMLLVFVVPGLVINWMSGLKLPWALTASVPVSLGVLGFIGWLSGLDDSQNFTRDHVVIALVMCAVLALLWRWMVYALYRWRARRRHDRQHTALSPPELPETTGNDAGPGEKLAAFAEHDEVTVDSASSTADAGPAAQPGSAVAVDASGSASAPNEEASIDPSASRRRWKDMWSPSHWSAYVTGSIGDPVWVIPAAGVLVGMWLMIIRALETLDRARYGVESIYQGWDVQWHANEVTFIVRDHVASATRMGELMNQETQLPMYYPSAWHDLTGFAAMITGLDPVVAVNLAGIILPGVLLPCSAAALTWRLCDSRSMTAQVAAGLAPIIVAGIPAFYWVGMYVGAWPYLAAIAAAGIVIALLISVTAAPVRAFAACWAFVGAVQTHPSAVTVIVVPVVLWWLTRGLWKPAHRSIGFRHGLRVRLWETAVLAATGLVGSMLVMPQILAGMQQSGEVESFEATEDVTRAEAWAMAAKLATRHAEVYELVPMLWWSALAGAIMLLVWRRSIFGQLTYLLSLAVCVNAILPFDAPLSSWLSAIGSLHYNTPHRLIMPVVLLTAIGSALCIAGTAAVIAWLLLRRFPRLQVALIGLLGLGTGVLLYPAVSAATAEPAEFAINHDRNGRMVDTTDLQAFDWLMKQPHAFDGHIFGDPADGMGWMYATNGLPSFFRHYLWPVLPEQADTSLLYWYPDKLGVGNFDDPDMANAVDEAAARQNITFYYVSPPTFWAFQEPALEMILGLWETPGVTPVYKDKQVSIFAVNAAFTDAELIAMRKPGNSPEPLPPLVTKGEMGVANSQAEINEPYFHRPTTPLTGNAESFVNEREQQVRATYDQLWHAELPEEATE
ncbi:DUF6541 family protein [Corynebacterium choanae]|uniref:Uncharacterized protein n=1 Tax=Corynebacterium choanae TaxID=1862358 RepID=A0A3G6J843_9CORY|nr:DUF6541 family protein [Corynebacterium choanae]AZA14281.1 hypothetical protein CCHOA_09490 [Corynebacterium choanae]